MSQIQNLARDASWFGKGSRIIITTRNQEVLVRMDKTFELTEMNAEEALQLFCKHAFGMDSPPNDYNNLSKEAVESTGRLPLTLEVIGLQLRHEPHEEWAEIIERLKKIPHKDVQKKLLISYESLSHGAQQIFLDIACFFIGYGNTNPMYMWEACKFDAKMGLKELINKSLVKIVVVDLNGPAKEETFRMHDQLRDLGRDIAKHNRIWMREDALNFLRNMEDEVNVEMFRLCDNDYYFRPEDIDKISCEEFSGLKKLRYFECRGAIFSCNMQGLLPNLRWLSWRCCPVEFTGTCLSLKKLVILDLSRSDITEDWIGWSKIGEANNLKVLDLTGCDKLRRTPDLSNYSSLERLILEDCEDLVEIDRSIGRLKGLKFLNFNNCISLSGLPDELYSLDRLEVILGHPDLDDWPTDPPTKIFNFTKSVGNLTSLLTLRFCLFKTTRLPESIIRLSRLRHLALAGIVELPQRVGLLKELKTLELTDCPDMEKLPDSIGDMKSLVELNLSRSGITELPETIGNLEQLRVIDLTESQIHKLPNSIGKLKSLEELLVGSSSLVEIPTTIEGCSSLRIMDLNGCGNMEKLPDSIGYLTSLTELDLSETNFIELPSIVENLKELRMIRIDYSKIRELPPSIGMLKKLEELSAVHCVSFREIPSAIEGCTSLRELKLNNCADLKKLPDSVGNLRSLHELNLSRSGIIELPETIGNLNELTMLFVDHTGIQRLPASIGMLQSLQKLSALNCVSLREIPSTIEGCTLLKELDLNNCQNIRKLPDSVGNLRSLHKLDLSRSGIIELPETIGNLEALSFLSVDGTEIRRLPANIGMLKNLEELRATGCHLLEEIPPSIDGCTRLNVLGLKGCKNIKELSVSGCSLRSLQELNLSFSGMTELPETIGNLEALRVLSVDGTEIRRLPAKIGMLKNLKVLRATDCHLLEEIPSTIDGFTQLMKLDLKGCKNIKELPVSGCFLRSLKVLDLSCTGITELPDTIESLKKLGSLSVDGTQIRSLPASIGMLKKLRHLTARGCHLLEEIPSTIEGCTRLMTLDLKGCKNIKELPFSKCFLRSLFWLHLPDHLYVDNAGVIRSRSKLKIFGAEIDMSPNIPSDPES